jgi:hypothetical protein
MRNVVIVIVVMAFAVVPSILQSQPPQQKPIRKSFISTHYNVPSSLQEMVTSADAIVRGRVLGLSAKDLDREGTSSARAMTANRFTVLEVIRSGTHFVDAYAVDVLTEGGRRDRGEYIEEVVGDIPPLVPGHEYLVFLRWNDAASEWVVAYGADGVIDLHDGTVTSPGTSEVTNLQKGKPASDYLATVKRLRQPNPTHS